MVQSTTGLRAAQCCPQVRPLQQVVPVAARLVLVRGHTATLELGPPQHVWALPRHSGTQMVAV